MNHIFCIHSSVVGPLGCFQLLAITNKASKNIVEHVTLWHDGESFGYIPRVVLLGLQFRSISNLPRNLKIDFLSGCTSLQSYQQWRSVPRSPHPHQCVVTSGFVLSHSDWCRVESQCRFDLHFSDH